MQTASTLKNESRKVADVVDKELKSFFTDLSRALMNVDTPEASRLWNTPSIFISNTERLTFTTPVEVQEFIEDLSEQYTDIGIAAVYPELKDAVELSPNLYSVKIRWPYISEDNDEIGSEMTTYILQRNDDGHLKIACVVHHGGSMNSIH